MMFKDGFLYKNLSLKLLSTLNEQPTFDGLEKYRKPGETRDWDVSSLSTPFANRRKGHFMKGDRVVIVKGDPRNLKVCEGNVEEDTVHIKPSEEGLNHPVFVDDVAESSEVASGNTRIGNYELDYLVLLDDNSFSAVLHV